MCVFVVCGYHTTTSVMKLKYIQSETHAVPEGNKSFNRTNRISEAL